MVEFEVGSMESGKKVQRLVRQLLPGVPLSGIHKMIRTGRVKRNGRKAKPDDVLVVGDVIRLYMSETDYEVVRKPTHKYHGVSREIRLLYEDDQCLAVNKPAGLLTHGDKAEQKDTLVNRVLAYLHDRGELDESPFKPAPVNRLDRNTSGIVLFGKTSEALRLLAQSIQSGSTGKWYVAIVKGQLPDYGTIDASLERLEDKRTIVGRGGKSAETRFSVLVRSDTTCVALVELVTGRTHQIRAHFEHLGCPLWGDVKYGGGKSQYGSAEDKYHGSQTGVHQWLHAMWVKLPNLGLIMAPLPDDYIRTLKKLGYRTDQIERLSAPPI